MRCAVVGHVEWVEFARVPRLPGAGEIVHAERVWQEPAGGGAVVARQLALLAGRCELFTALGEDELGRGSAKRLAELGIDVHVRWGGATRRAWTHVDGDGERTITVLGDKLLPRGPLPLQGYDLVFFVSDTLFWPLLYAFAFTGEPYHVGVIFQTPDGSFALLEAGPPEVAVQVQISPLLERLEEYAGRVFIRRRAVPLTPEQSEALTGFALRQEGKPYAIVRFLLQGTPIRSRGPVRTEWLGKSRDLLKDAPAGVANDDLFLAMAHQKLGRAPEAKMYYQRAKEAIDRLPKASGLFRVSSGNRTVTS